MRAFIQSFQGRPWNEDCRAALNGFRELGVECVLFGNDEELAQRQREDIVVAGMIVTGSVLSELGIKPQNLDYPKELEEFLFRKIRTITLSDLKSEKLPVFIKPVEEKLADGMVIRSINDIGDYAKLPPETQLYCSEVLDIKSEWRCFVRYGEIEDIRLYKGDGNFRCDIYSIETAVFLCDSLPAGCSLDFGVTGDGKTCLIEINDGYSLGCYGLDEVQYAKLLYARWAELTGVKDIFK